MPETLELPEFLTVHEVAGYLRLPLSTVYKLVQDKVLPGFKVGKHWRFRRDSIMEWVDQQENRYNDESQEIGSSDNDLLEK